MFPIKTFIIIIIIIIIIIVIIVIIIFITIIISVIIIIIIIIIIIHTYIWRSLVLRMYDIRNSSNLTKDTHIDGGGGVL